MKALLFVLAITTAISQQPLSANTTTIVDPAEVTLGERLFLETRFAQSWYKDPNKADPTLAKTLTTNKPVRGAFAGKTMNCRACHMVDEHNDELGMRIYADFAALSPIPNRNDGMHKTGRNSMGLVNINKADVDNILFHFDGEFNSLEDLVIGTFTGRNFGWKVNEKAIAVKHIASIIRNDDGKGELASEFGGSYHNVLKGTDKNLTKEFRLPAEYRIDTATASDLEILNAVAKLVTAYMNDLSFSTDENGQYNGSPYDTFLSLNKLPRAPAKNESAAAYGQRLLHKINQLENPVFVSSTQRSFESHQQKFAFSEKALKGMQLFLRAGNGDRSGGNCASCHQLPHFTDFSFHNTGISQNQYDKLHGAGAFNTISIPNLAQRSNNAAYYLPASTKHPIALSTFRSLPSKKKPGATDLGLWNIVLNDDMPAPQKKIKSILCKKEKASCTPTKMLNKSIAAFKTPTLRDLGHSAPYMHSGGLNTLQEVLTMYLTNSELARQHALRNTDSDMKKIRLNTSDVENLLAFLNSLNEDYD